jgi:putative pyruvate formate lyase activating enzyme
MARIQDHFEMQIASPLIPIESLRFDTLSKKVEIMLDRLDEVRSLARECRLCPHECRIDRTQGVLGTCKIPYGPTISSANLHHGEEPPISGSRGSGTIFFNGCNLRCLFCQNFPISQLRHGKAVSIGDLADEMIHLQRLGAHNINLVTPTPQAAAIFEALILAFQKGLELPIVYNSGGFESLEMLRLWDGIIDVYLPDAKYACNESSRTISRAPGYPEHNHAALKEMHRQVGTLRMDEEGIAMRGLLVRHLVLPGDLSGTEEVLRFLATELGADTYISLMSQYFPAWHAHEHPILRRKLTKKEYDHAIGLLDQFNMQNGWVQPYGGEDETDRGGC